MLAWVAARRAECVTTVINRAEVLAGIALLPPGQRRRRLDSAARAAFGDLGVCLPLTDDAADEYAAIVASRTRSGTAIGAMAALVAAIALAAGAPVATRDTSGFADLGIDVLDPWEGAADPR